MKTIILLLLPILLFSSFAYSTADLTIHNTGNLAAATPFISQQQTTQNNQTTLTYTLTEVANLAAWQIDIYSPDKPMFLNATFNQNPPFPPSITITKQINSTDTQLTSAFLNKVVATGTGVLAVAVFNTTQARFYINRLGTILLDNNMANMSYWTDPNETVYGEH